MGHFRASAHRTAARLAQLTASHKYTLFWRTSSRSHRTPCDADSSPMLLSNLSFADQSDYGWMLRAPMNDIWRDALSRERAGSWAEHAHLMDIDDLSSTRPDAHRYAPEADCLHWCSSSVTDEWTWALWHLLQAAEEESS